MSGPLQSFMCHDHLFQHKLSKFFLWREYKYITENSTQFGAQFQIQQ